MSLNLSDFSALSKMGAHRKESQQVEFRIWAPKAKSLSLVIAGKDQKTHHPMQSDDFGIFQISLPYQSSPMDYFYCIDGDRLRPDPASRWQPFGVHGPSRVYDPKKFEWNDQSWKGIALSDYLIYELHIGTFTPEGTFEAAINKLPHLRELGITAIELMPIIEFPNDRNWGYDGVYPYAPHHSYGGPNGLKRLIDACHQEGLAVIIDVVYNHLGPEGNYLSDFGFYFTDHYKTPWGKAINFDGAYSDAVRDFFIENALYWLEEYHVDALRLDAIHSIFDFSACHILKEMREVFHKKADELGRTAYIIAESDLNDVRLLNPLDKGGYAIDSQWNDDFHHALYALLTKSQWGYFADFGHIADLTKAIKDGFVYDGKWSSYRKKRFGSSSRHIPGDQFVVCIQNHDQIGNAAQGIRLGRLVDADQYRLASVILFCASNIPLLFMGQEWNATTPFLFFTSYEDEALALSVREGYHREFQLNPLDSSTLDPQDVNRFNQSKLKWSELPLPAHQEMFRFYQRLISLRKELKCLSNSRKDLTKTQFSENEKWLVVHRSDPSGSEALLIANLAADVQEINVFFSPGSWVLKLYSAAHQNPNITPPNSLNFAAGTSCLIPVQANTALLYVRQ